jgi:hypothetical protein
MKRQLTKENIHGKEWVLSFSVGFRGNMKNGVLLSIPDGFVWKPDAQLVIIKTEIVLWGLELLFKITTKSIQFLKYFQCSSFFILFYYHIIVLLGAFCDIYKSFYNIP